ncbi:MAG: PadR family transcriptional regulator [Alphaproteobacteria bacterium]|nr:MAG: PadR family transcriptional regulator [Alphaproteobacteria bacterium]
MPVGTDILEALRLELRRGTLILAVLGTLRAEKYGYTLKTELGVAGIEIDEGALYPMLRRLETQGLLTSEWREDAKRQKRFYRLSEDGEAALEYLAGEWRAMNGALDSILKNSGPPRSGVATSPKEGGR